MVSQIQSDNLVTVGFMAVKERKISWYMRPGSLGFLVNTKVMLSCIIKQSYPNTYCAMYTHIAFSFYLRVPHLRLQNEYLWNIISNYVWISWREGVITFKNDLSLFSCFARWQGLGWFNPLISADIMHVRSARWKRILEKYERHSDRLCDITG